MSEKEGIGRRDFFRLIGLGLASAACNPRGETKTSVPPTKTPKPMKAPKPTGTPQPSVPTSSPTIEIPQTTPTPKIEPTPSLVEIPFDPKQKIPV